MLGLAACSKQGDSPKAAQASGAGGGAMAALPKLGPAPAWNLKDVDGNAVSSAKFAGKVVVVDFWATWCGPCVREIPGYIALQKKYGADKLAIVGVSLDQAGPEVVQAFALKHGVNYQMVMADDAVVRAFGGVNVIPTTFLIDRTGQVRDRKEGAEDEAA